MFNLELLNFLGVSFPSLAILEGKGGFALRLYSSDAAEIICDSAKGKQNVDSATTLKEQHVTGMNKGFWPKVVPQYQYNF